VLACHSSLLREIFTQLDNSDQQVSAYIALFFFYFETFVEISGISHRLAGNPNVGPHYTGFFFINQDIFKDFIVFKITGPESRFF
jgi:hypothetical protein